VRLLLGVACATVLVLGCCATVALLAGVAPDEELVVLDVVGDGVLEA
jgi:hypothetical protein